MPALIASRVFLVCTSAMWTWFGSTSYEFMVIVPFTTVSYLAQKVDRTWLKLVFDWMCEWPWIIRNPVIYLTIMILPSQLRVYGICTSLLPVVLQLFLYFYTGRSKMHEGLSEHSTCKMVCSVSLFVLYQIWCHDRGLRVYWKNWESFTLFTFIFDWSLKTDLRCKRSLPAGLTPSLARHQNWHFLHTLIAHIVKVTCFTVLQQKTRR